MQKNCANSKVVQHSKSILTTPGPHQTTTATEWSSFLGHHTEASTSRTLGVAALRRGEDGWGGGGGHCGRRGGGGGGDQ